jgi:glycerol-3-phosphate dehydrogenase
VLARRSRLRLLDAQLASSLAAQVNTILQEDTGVDPPLAAFLSLARQYQHLWA